jgi:hypothetical protein
MSFNERIEMNRFYIKRRAWNYIVIVFIIIAVIFLILLNFDIIFSELNFDIIFQYWNPVMFGVRFNNFSSIIYLLIGLLIIEIPLTFLGGFIGETINYIYRILILFLFYIPFAFAIFYIVVEDVLEIQMGLDLAWFIISLAVIRTLVYIIDIWKVLYEELEEDDDIEDEDDDHSQFRFIKTYRSNTTKQNHKIVDNGSKIVRMKPPKITTEKGDKSTKFLIS